MSNRSKTLNSVLLKRKAKAYGQAVQLFRETKRVLK